MNLRFKATGPTAEVRVTALPDGTHEVEVDTRAIRDAALEEAARVAREAVRKLEHVESRWARVKVDKGDDADTAEISSGLSDVLGMLDRLATLPGDAGEAKR